MRRQFTKKSSQRLSHRGHAHESHGAALPPELLPSPRRSRCHLEPSLTAEGGQVPTATRDSGMIWWTPTHLQIQQAPHPRDRNVYLCPKRRGSMFVEMLCTKAGGSLNVPQQHDECTDGRTALRGASEMKSAPTRSMQPPLNDVTDVTEGGDEPGDKGLGRPRPANPRGCWLTESLLETSL